MAYSYDRRKVANWATLFVYGSLRRAGEDHHKMGDAVFMGAARTAPLYTLQSVQNFAALAPGTESVMGELYLCSPAKLAELDDWEYDIFVRTTILLEGGRQVQAYMLAEAQRTAAQYEDKIPGGLADKGPPPGVSKTQVEKGIKVEMEHTDDKEVAREITYDHLTEDPKYYDKLETIEKSAGYNRR